LRIESIDSRQGDIGFELDPSYWGQGYASEAARAMLEFGFTEIDLHRIWARCNAENDGSVRLLEKLGMQREGRLRENEYFKGRWWDTMIFAVLESEWKGGRASGAG
jgi:RimJ/RimL family protein N-acetyltransferase